MGDNLVSIIAQHLNTLPVAPVQHNSALPTTLNTLILQLLAKRPEQRPASAAAVQATLQSLATATAAPHTLTRTTPTLDRLARDMFVGREREMDILRTSLEETLAGQDELSSCSESPALAKHGWQRNSPRMRRYEECACTEHKDKANERRPTE